MTEYKITVQGDHEVAAQMRGSARLIDAEVKKVTQHHGQLLRTRIRAKASGRPGPRAITGDYRRSWDLIVRSSGHESTATAGTNAVQGRRLEFGFHGADSLGRVYAQPPFPHAGPAFDETVPGFIAGMQAVADSIGGK